ncbi:MAG TPA: acyltransferase family protein [Acidimicrobiales bacterium]|nr:acyltransferase family protein [Acidimicrobiales bacterium]
MLSDARVQRSERAPLRADVQGLRAVAVLLVLGAHVFGFPRGGFIGVDVFFVISGYLITGLLSRELDRSGRVSIRDFYARRARRILPMAVLVLVATVVGAHVIFTSLRAHQTTVDAWWAFGFLANVHFASIGTNYFAAHRAQSAVQQYWSLAVEEQFYLVWPWVLFVTFAVARRARLRRSTAVIAGVSFVLVALSFAASVHLTKLDPAGSYFSAFTRAWELGIGALASIIQPAALRITPRVRAAGAWVGLAGIAIAALAISDATPFPGWAAAAPVVATAVVLLAADPRGGVGERFALGSAPSLYLGKISYSLYLWHWPAIIFATAYYPHSTHKAELIALVGALALSAASNTLLEEPIRHSLWLSKKPQGWVRPRRRGLGELIADNERVALRFAAAAVALAIWFAWALVNTGGSTNVAATTPAAAVDPALDAAAPSTTLATEADPLQALIKSSLLATSWGPLTPSLDALPKAGAPEMIHDNCLSTNAANEARCSYGSPAAPHVAVLLGDSIAASYMPGIRGALKETDWRIQMLTLKSCAMVDTPMQVSDTHKWENKDCTAHHAWALHEVQRINPELVIMASNHEEANQILGAGPQGSAQNFSRWHDALVHTLQEVTAPGRRVVVIGAPPRSGNLQECVTRVSKPQDCNGVLSDDWLAVRRAEQTAAVGPGVTYVDPEDWFCYHATCPAVIGSTPVYWDGIHITAAYSRTLAPELAKPLLGT